MSIHTCGDFPSDPYCTCYSQTKEQTHEYRQFNKTNQTYSCCDIIPLNPIGVFETAGGCSSSDFSSAVGYLEYLDDKSITPGCSYSGFFGGNTTETSKSSYLQNNFPTLFHNATINYQMYNNFVCNNGTSKAIPTQTETSITCTGDNVPYLAQYKTNLDNSPYYSYMTICSNQSFQKITTGTEGVLDYQVSRFQENSGNPCTTASCTLPYESGNYNNLGNEGPIFDGKVIKNNNSYLVAGCVILVLGLIIFGVLGYYIYKEDEELQSSSTKKPQKV
tara:strand:- start:7895 stop:8722 length:828 start_codon:yes stop_codon:yes gene_type:complete